MKRVLVVSPNWPPVAYPDMQRARMASAHLREFGWEPLILAVDPEEQVGAKDPLLEKTLPGDLKTWSASAISKSLTSPFGVSSVAYRSLFHLARLGSRIIERERPDLVFFSTTMFVLFSLGPYWRRRHGIPYVLDFQDPWVSNYEGARRDSWQRIKRAVVDLIGRSLEPCAVRGASHIVCVSPAYPEMLRRRYPDVPADRFIVLPFAAAERDFEILSSAEVSQTIFDPRDGLVHWVYAGRGGSDIEFSVRAFLSALSVSRAADPGQFGQVRVHFVGTAYAPGSAARESVTPIARECGVGDLVTEHPERIGYFPALKCLQQAHALVIFGSDDPGYTASKIYPYVLARRPMLGVFHESSSAAEVFRSTGCGELATFRSGEAVEALARRIRDRWFSSVHKSLPATDWDKFETFSARHMSRVLGETFDRACKSG